MSIEARTVRPHATGAVTGRWHERFGAQRLDVRVNPDRPDTEVRVTFERRWGPQLSDQSTQSIVLSREGAETLRDALSAALEWEAT